jgi:hypothetical protein
MEFSSIFPRRTKTMRLPLFIVLVAVSLRLSAAFPTHEEENEEQRRDEVDSESSRKIIGQR